MNPRFLQIPSDIMASLQYDIHNYRDNVHVSKLMIPILLLVESNGSFSYQYLMTGIFTDAWGIAISMHDIHGMGSRKEKSLSTGSNHWKKKTYLNQSNFIITNNKV